MKVTNDPHPTARALVEALRGAHVTLSSLVVMLRNEMSGDVDHGLRRLNCMALVEALRDVEAALVADNPSWTPSNHCNWTTKHGRYVYEYCRLPRGHEGEHVMDFMDGELTAAHDAGRREGREDARTRALMALRARYNAWRERGGCADQIQEAATCIAAIEAALPLDDAARGEEPSE
jgi:hypothetical protein